MSRAAGPATPQPSIRRRKQRSRHRLRLRARVRALRIRAAALPGGRTVFRVAVASSGGVVVAVGLVLVPLPGPGWAIVFGGLAIWAVEFAWARHLLNWVRRRVRTWTRWVGTLGWPVRIALGTAVVVGLASVAWLWIKTRYGFETAAQFWDYITTH